MKIKLWGTRGSVAAPGPETIRYGGNTSCVGVQGRDGNVLVLDAGTGVRRLGVTLIDKPRRIDLLLTHLHLDHLQGIGFFAPLRLPDFEVHIWGPASTTLHLRDRLSRYLSPPLFPVYMRDLASDVILHEVAGDEFSVGEFDIKTALVGHHDPTVGFRITSAEGSVTYLPDHEPALGTVNFPIEPEWTSGYGLAAGADILIHDCQYTMDQYESRVGWGHSAMPHAFKFAELAEVKRFIPFHHDPNHSDADLDRLLGEQIESHPRPFITSPGIEGETFEL